MRKKHIRRHEMNGCLGLLIQSVVATPKFDHRVGEDAADGVSDYGVGPLFAGI